MIEELVANASRLRRTGRFAEAAGVYKELLAARPDLAESWYNLAWVQRQLGQYDEALKSYRCALDAGVSSPEEVHLNRAAILALQPDRQESVLAELRSALAIDPDYVPALLNLGNFEEDRGQRDKARRNYERALMLDPANSLALARLAGVSLATDPGDPLIARLRAALASPAIDDSERADLGFALGRLLDQCHAYDSAFSAYRAANVASVRVLHGVPRYDRRAHEQMIDRIMAVFDRPASTPRGRSGAPLFICGMFRSGSTLAEQILAGHSQVAAGGELDLIPTLIRDSLQPYPEAAAAIDSATIARFRQSYLDGLGGLGRSGQLVTDKRPDNFLHIGLIKTLFPQAKIIHTRRNPLDNILSLYFLHLNPAMSYATDLIDSAHWYSQQERLMAHWKSLYPDDIFELDYDLLVRRPLDQITALLDHCGLAAEEGLLSFHTSPRPVRTASVWQVREPLYQRGSGRWRHYERHLKELRTALDLE